MVVRVVVPVTADGVVDPRWGRAGRVAVAAVTDGAVEDWQEYDVGWDALHDAGSERVHHARVARFLREQDISVVVAAGMGEGMARMLERLGLRLRLGAAGETRSAAARGAVE